MQLARPKARVYWAAALPLLPVALALAAWPLPATDDAISLAGAWLFRDGAADARAVDVDERTFTPFTVPGRFGKGTNHCWVRRHFDLPPSFVGRDQFLVVPR